MMIKRILLCIVMCALTFSCFGCSNDNKGINKKQKDDEVGELTIYSHKADTLCPIASVNKANARMLSSVYDGLIELSDSLVPIGALAESWSVSEDGLFWTVNIRDNAIWHDQSGVLLPEDIIYTVNQIKRLEKSPYKYNVSNVESIEKISENSVRFKLFSPKANFINLLYFPIIKAGEDEIDLVNFKPNGTGPYKIEDHTDLNAYYLIENDNWWGGKIKAKTIRVKILPNDDTALYAFGAGDLDLVPADNMDWGKSLDSSKASYTTVKTPIYNFLGINHKRVNLSMPELRRAISFVVNRAELVEEARMGYGVSANSPVRPEWFVAENQKFDYKQNMAEAERVMNENGWVFEDNLYRKSTGGVTHRAEFSILINEENAARENIARIISGNLETFGIQTNIVRVSYEEYEKRINDGEYDTFIGSMALSPDLDFSVLLGRDNMFGFEDEEMSFVVNEIAQKTKPEDIKAKHAEFINLFEQLNPIVGLFFENSVLVYTKEIKEELKPSYFDVYNGIETLQKGAEDK